MTTVQKIDTCGHLNGVVLTQFGARSSKSVFGNFFPKSQNGLYSGKKISLGLFKSLAPIRVIMCCLVHELEILIFEDLEFQILK